MLIPPDVIVPILQPFSTLFHHKTWTKAQLLLFGAILSPRKRTITSALRVMGLGSDHGFAKYHHVLNRAVFSPLQLLLLVQHLGQGDEPMVFGIDETIERRRGRRISALGVYRDAVRSSDSHVVKTTGLRWISLMWLANIPWAHRTWALPVLTALAPSEQYHRQVGLPHKKITDWARQMILQLRRFGVPFLNPCVNGSGMSCAPQGGSVRLGLRFIKDVGSGSAALILEERERHGPYASAGDLVRRTGLKPQAVLSLVMAGAFDGITPNRREALWEAGLYNRPARNGQMALSLSMEDGVPELEDFTDREKMAGEYRVMGIYPRGHLMEFVRPYLSDGVLPAVDVDAFDDGDEVRVAGWPVARQHPKGWDGTVFVTIEDETGDVQVILWQRVFERCRRELGSQVIEVIGVVSKWDDTTNVIASDVRPVQSGVHMPRSHDWH